MPILTDAFALTEPLAGCCVNPDKDGDGFNGASCGGSDCDDNPFACGAACNPGAVEICDGYDNDCNGEVDDNIACKDTLIKKFAHYPSIIGDHSCVEDSSTHMIYCFGGIDRASTNEPQTDTIVRYDPGTDRVTTMPAKLPSIRDGLSCRQDAATHKIYCFGGYAQEFYCISWNGSSCVGGYSIVHYLDDILEYNPQTDTLSEKPETLPTGIDGLSCVENASTHKTYCLGGASYGPDERNAILEYDPATDTLSTMSAVLPSGRYLASCARDSSSNKIYCFGGRSDAGSLGEIVEYDPASDTVTTMEATFPLVINRLSCVEDSASHKIYCFGGHSTDRDYLGSYYVDKIFEYDPSSDTLTMMDASFTHGRYSLSCAQDSSSNKIYCIGGSRNVVCHDDIHEYITELWLPGDFDHDCSVGTSDLAVFSLNFGKSGCSAENPCQGDFTVDLDVDGRDLAKIGGSFGLYDCPFLK